MPINLQGSGNIAEGWPGPPQLSAPNISGLVSAILENRLVRDKMTQGNIANTIKQFQQQRESQAYLEAMQKAGILPEGDYGALGAEGASDLAKQILAKKVADARAEHLTKMEARLSAGGGRSRGGGSGGKNWQGQETWWDAQGREWREGPGGRPIPVKPVGGTKAGDGTDISKAVKEQLGLQEKFGMLEEDRKKQEAADVAAGAKDPNYPQKVPFKQSDLYNTTRNRLKQLEAIPGMPSTTPQGTPQPAPADKNLAPGYGTDATSMSSDDVRAAYRAGKMTREEAQARLKQMGFSD